MVILPVSLYRLKDRFFLLCHNFVVTLAFYLLRIVSIYRFLQHHNSVLEYFLAYKLLKAGLSFNNLEWIVLITGMIVAFISLWVVSWVNGPTARLKKREKQ